MTSRTFLRIAFLCLVAVAASSSLRAGDLAPSEKGKIEALISHLESLRDATFVRNGVNYDSKTAAKFLRGKWQAHEKEIHTADEFVVKVASRSSTSGKPYLIRLHGSSETLCAAYLTAQLKTLETAAPHK